MNMTENRKSNFIYAFAWIIKLGICFPFVVAAGNAVFKTDDFANYNTFVSTDGEGILSKSIRATVDLWYTWQGTYSSNFLMYLLNPLQNYSFVRLRFILASIVIGALVGLYLFIRELLLYFEVNKKYAIYFELLFLVPMLTLREYDEVYLWYTGTMVYLLPVLFMCFSLLFTLYSKRKKARWPWTVLASFSAILMSGGVLELVGMGMTILLLLNLFEAIRTKKLFVPFVIVFFSGLAGALLNVCAPGNYVRHSVIDDSSINILNSVKYTLICFIQECTGIYKSTVFIAFFVLAIFLGYCINKEWSMFKMLLSICSLVCVPIITLYPVVLGYSRTELSLPNRCQFLLDAAMYASGVGIALVLGSYFKKFLPEFRFTRFVCVGYAIVMLVYHGPALKSYIPCSIIWNLAVHNTQNYNAEWIDIFDQIRYSESDDVVIIKNLPQRQAGCTDCYLAEDSSEWVNVAVASYFGKNSVLWLPEDELDNKND